MKAVCGAVLVAFAAAGAAQPAYRADQPAVLERTAPDENGAWEAVRVRFSRAYADAGRPRILLMWHRAVSDRISDERRVTRSTVSAGMLARDNYAQEVVIRWRERPATPGSFLAPIQAADYETGLTQSLLSAGVRLVDRNVAIRMTALKGTAGGHASAAMDNATVEAQAFADMADQILQVQLLPDANAPAGWRARLTLVEVRTGRVVADSLVDATQQRSDAQSARTWVATDKGFEQRAAALALSSVARKDVLALMNAIAPRP
jgi:hypothetical protein